MYDTNGIGGYPVADIYDVGQTLNTTEQTAPNDTDLSQEGVKVEGVQTNSNNMKSVGTTTHIWFGFAVLVGLILIMEWV